MQTKLGNDFFFAKTPYKDRVFVAQGLNGVWSKKESMYRFPKNLHAMREILKSYPELMHDENFLEAGRRLRQNQDRFLQLKQLEDTIGDPRLRPYQKVDVNYLKQLPAAGIFNEPRTGKTPTSILLMKEKQFRSVLVVCPASLIWNWAKEFKQWYPEPMVYVVNGTPKKRKMIIESFLEDDGKKVLIVSKDTWKSEPLDFTFDACFVDEAHFLRNQKTAQTKAIHEIKATNKYALTGTPTVKHGSDIWGILHFLYPKKFPSYWQFLERYFVITQDHFGYREIGGVKEGRKEELQELIGFISVQRKREEVMKWLPEKQYIHHYAKMDTKQQKIYNQMVDDMLAQDEENEDSPFIDVSNTLSQLLRLRQLCLDPRLLGFTIVGAKTKALLEWLDDNREPVVIMSMFTSYFDLIQKDIEKLGVKVGRLDGKMSNKEKDNAASQFQEGKIDVLLCNIISAGVGFTLDRAKVIIFMDKAWNPSDNQQAEDRITPTTQEKNHAHEVISIIVPDSIDEHVNTILEHKQSLTDVVNNGGREAIRKLLNR